MPSLQDNLRILQPHIQLHLQTESNKPHKNVIQVIRTALQKIPANPLITDSLVNILDADSIENHAPHFHKQMPRNFNQKNILALEIGWL